MVDRRYKWWCLSVIRARCLRGCMLGQKMINCINSLQESKLHKKREFEQFQVSLQKLRFQLRCYNSLLCSYCNPSPYHRIIDIRGVCRQQQCLQTLDLISNLRSLHSLLDFLQSALLLWFSFEISKSSSILGRLMRTKKHRSLFAIARLWLRKW